MDKFGVKSYETDKEKTTNELLISLLKETPIPADQILSNLGLFLSSKNLARLKFLDHIYQQILEVHGIVFDFGTRWGQNMAFFASLRGIYEPFNRHRKIVGFDTFSGFPSVHEFDGSSELMKAGNVACPNGYEEYLEQIMICQENQNPASHIVKHEIIKGDACEEILKYLQRHPETIVSLAYFDFDLYEPTYHCLREIQDRLVKGSIVAFDELCDHDSPGETKALYEVLGVELKQIRLQRVPYASRTSYFVVE